MSAGLDCNFTNDYDLLLTIYYSLFTIGENEVDCGPEESNDTDKLVP